MRGRFTVPSLVSLVLISMALPAAARKRDGAAQPATAPSFSLPGRQGTVTLASLSGKVVYVDFWASWCAPCRASFPWLRAMHERYASRGLTIVAINLDKDRPLAEGFLGEFPAPFLIAFDPAGKTAEAFQVSTMPSSFLVGRDGSILFSHAGFDSKDAGDLEARIREALNS